MISPLIVMSTDLEYILPAGLSRYMLDIMEAMTVMYVVFFDRENPTHMRKYNLLFYHNLTISLSMLLVIVRHFLIHYRSEISPNVVFYVLYNS